MTASACNKIDPGFSTAAQESSPKSSCPQNIRLAADGTQIAVDVLDGMKNVPADKLKEVAEQLEQLKSLATAALR